MSILSNSPSRSKRILTILVFFLLSIVITIAGVLTPLSSKDSKDLNNDLKQIQDETKNMTVWQSTIFIFANNFRLCLLMFIPIAGPLIGSYIMYSSGLVIGAWGHENNVSSLIAFVALFISPHTWLEFMAYSIAFAASVWLTWRATKHQFKKEILQTCKFIAICALILLAAAFIEAYLIAALPSA